VIKQTGADISEEVNGIGPHDPFVTIQRIFPGKVTEFMQVKFIDASAGFFSAIPGRVVAGSLIMAFYSGFNRWLDTGISQRDPDIC
jgi:hypothetical protein